MHFLSIFHFVHFDLHQVVWGVRDMAIADTTTNQNDLYVTSFLDGSLNPPPTHSLTHSALTTDILTDKLTPSHPYSTRRFFIFLSLLLPFCFHFVHSPRLLRFVAEIIVLWLAFEKPWMDGWQHQILKGVKGAKKKRTDTHWRSKKGKGNFNWRMKFPIALPARRWPRLQLAVWDKGSLGPASHRQPCAVPC